MSEMDSEVDHYLRAVTELGDTHEIVASDHIYSDNGIKLVAAGIRITSKLYERLVAYKLKMPLDMSVSVSPSVALHAVAEDINLLIKENRILRHVHTELTQSIDVGQLIAGLALPPPLVFRLTMAKEKFPNLYQRQLVVLLLVLYLSHCKGCTDEDSRMLALAALFHNIGMMHVDPKLIADGYEMTRIEKRHIYAHPLTAYMLLSKLPEVPGKVAEAVLEYRERMDGSGYPRGLSENKLGDYGKMLAVGADATRAFASMNPGELYKLAVTLKVNTRLYGKGLIGYLVRAIILFDDKGYSMQREAAMLDDHIALVSGVLERFNTALQEAPSDEILLFIRERLMRLRVDFSGAGISIDSLGDSITQFSQDEALAYEYVPLVNEAVWQVKAIFYEAARRWPHEYEIHMLDEHSQVNQLKNMLFGEIQAAA